MNPTVPAVHVLELPMSRREPLIVFVVACALVGASIEGVIDGRLCDKFAMECYAVENHQQAFPWRPSNSALQVVDWEVRWYLVKSAFLVDTI